MSPFYGQSYNFFPFAYGFHNENENYAGRGKLGWIKMCNGGFNYTLNAIKYLHCIQYRVVTAHLGPLPMVTDTVDTGPA